MGGGHGLQASLQIFFFSHKQQTWVVFLLATSSRPGWAFLVARQGDLSEQSYPSSLGVQPEDGVVNISHSNTLSIAFCVFLSWKCLLQW